MKKSKLGKVLTVLVIIAICLISFAGIFIKKQGQMENILRDYNLGMNLSGSRVAKFTVSEATEEVIYDAEGNIATDGENEDGTLKEGYKKENVAVNSQEVLNEENYQAVKTIMEKRLESMGVSEYNVKLNHQNGEIILELPENAHTDEIISNLTYLGSFEIKDSETDEVLINNKDVKKAAAVYGSTDTGTAVYLSIEFNKDGRQKLEDITKKYISTTDEEGKTVTKNIKIELDGQSMLETYFGETISTGILQLSIGNASTSNEEISSYIEQASQVAGLIDNGVMPIKYELGENNYISASIDAMVLKVVLGVIASLLIISFVYWIVRYRTNGIFAVISSIGLIAICSIVIRYANVVVSVEALVAIISVLVANYLVLQYALKQFAKEEENKEEIIKQTYKRYASILFPILIIAIVFTFTTWLPIASIGMIIFWGIAILAIYNYIIMKLLLEVKKGKEK